MLPPLSLAGLLMSFAVGATGPLFPCPRAASSPTGRFLVLVSTRTTPEIEPGRRQPVTIQSMSFEVFPREEFVNAKDRLSSGNASWTDWPRWRLTLSGREIRSLAMCPAVLVSDDGEFLSLLRTGPTSADDAALRIFRWDHTRREGTSSTNLASHVGDLTLRQLWPADRLPSAAIMWTDESPQWFAGGSFHFSTDSRSLVYATLWGTTATIELSTAHVADASITRAYADANHRVHIVLRGGGTTVVPPQQGQVGVDAVAVSADSQMVGWLVQLANPDGGTPYAAKLVVWRGGRIVRTLTAPQTFWSWSFEPRVGAAPSLVAVHAGPMHGEQASHCELREIESGRLVAAWDGDLQRSDRPAWTKGLNH